VCVLATQLQGLVLQSMHCQVLTLTPDEILPLCDTQ